MSPRGGKAPSEADEDDYMENVVHRLVRVVFPGWEEADGAMNEHPASLSALFPLKLFPVFLPAFPLVEVGGVGVVSSRSVDEVENFAVSVSAFLMYLTTSPPWSGKYFTSMGTNIFSINPET